MIAKRAITSSRPARGVSTRARVASSCSEHAQVQPVAPGQLGDGAQAHAAVQVAVQLRLGQRAQRVLIEHIAPDRQSL